MSTEKTAPAEHVPWRRYVAVGDSFTEGLSDPDPRSPGRYRGWADLLAAELSRRRRAAGEAPLEYANLAVRGRLLRPIVAEQLPLALEQRPDLVSLVGGGNDLLRPGSDTAALLAELEAAALAARDAGATVLLATGFDPAGSPVVRRTRPRVAAFNAGLWSVARRTGARVLDLWGMRSLADWRMWAPDRIHLTTQGHRRVAEAALTALGLSSTDPAWDDPLAPLPLPTRADRWRSDLRWTREYAYPWLRRRLAGRSSGDSVTAKRPLSTPVEEG